MKPAAAINYLWGFDIPALFKGAIPPRLYKDFVQHCYFELYRVSPNKLQKIWESGKLKDYFFMLCKHQLTDRKSRFWRDCGALTDVKSARIKFVNIAEYQPPDVERDRHSD
jgi:hypothetical protein